MLVNSKPPLHAHGLISITSHISVTQRSIDANEKIMHLALLKNFFSSSVFERAAVFV